MGCAALPELAPAHFPAAGPPGKRFVEHPRRFARQRLPESELVGRTADQILRWPSEQPLAGPVHQLQSLLGIERASAECSSRASRLHSLS